MYKLYFEAININVFKLTGSKAIGLKFSGKLGSPFLWIKMVTALIHCAGKVLFLNTSVQISNMNDLKSYLHYNHGFFNLNVSEI